jgi:hypothetical protein
MKKSLFSFILIRPILFIVLSFSLLHPHIVLATINCDDTAFYFNERGQLLWCNATADEQASYVVRTKKAYNEIFNELPSDDSTAQVTPAYNTAAVKNISRRTARKVERLLRHGAIYDPLVLDNIVPLQDKRIIRRMYENILYRCTTEDSYQYQEHGGVVFPDGTVTCITGDVSDPRWLAGAALLIKEKAMVYYHSHPDGTIEQTLTGDFTNARNPNRVLFTQTSQTQLISYVQGPSRQDQRAVGEGTGYVFGMKRDGGIIYIYDKEGVKATLPIAFAKQVKKTAAKHIKRSATYFAGLMPVLRLPYSF